MKKLLLIASLLISTHAFAGDSSSGCGLGWAVLKKNSLVSSFTRTFINATFSSTLGMTFGTSGCAQHSIVKNESKIIHFAESNYYQLQKEIALGSGSYITAFSGLIGCEDAALFNSKVQQNFDKIYPDLSTEPAAALKNILMTVQGDQELSRSCQII
ncbi:hypothetical protein BIY24_10905 [Halobacteriovorax marinus]|uniref:Lipoprotein n=1 Tax=Halobacteriovorax marinus (strain ATCC BAA-682 / DSM 15412 / SJ) TaxID=862908 RepID=E1X4Q4_HALMS|nr:DUF3015 domain-containing protein [Halobacteriovorax marinus]ATH08439.1 hypothetical protein BIY24_10905 [Halobacteriovorax marinus]CBW27130.1 conserved hypothetical protein [Halobacteriovorax marinus SJ]